MKLYLIVAKGKHQGMPIPIKVDLFLLGTDKMCQLRSKVPGVGPQQCAIVTRGKKVFLRDLGSGLPTLLDGELVPPGAEWPLHAGNRLSIGPLEFMVQLREKPLSQRDMEEWALRCLDVVSEREEDEDDPRTDAERKPTTASLAASAILDKLQARRGIVKGRLRVAREGLVTTIRFNDVHLVDESEIALVKKEIYDHVSLPNLRVLLDFKNVRRMSTVAAEMFAELHAWLRPWGSTLAMCRLQPQLRDVFYAVPALQSVPNFPDKKAALLGRW